MGKTNEAKQETKLVNEQGFRVFLAKRNLAEEIVKTHINIVKESDKHLKKRDGGKKIEKGIMRAILIADAVK
ncbi:MAG TPA: hypothetical protein VEH86_04790 [Candidatus Acidoferrum sp.]|nr:hypothetical protein [Candidatus Acidoferrum sp.]